MVEEEEDSVISRLIRENNQLKQRILELEETISQHNAETKTLKKDSQQVTQIMKILEIRDKQVEGYTQQLEARNQQLQMWVTSLTFYQQIFENDPVCLIGVNKEKKVVLYNKKVLDTFGEAFRDVVNKHISEVRFDKFDPYIPVMVEQTMNKRQQNTRKIKMDNSTIETICYPLGSSNEIKGVLIKIIIS